MELAQHELLQILRKRTGLNQGQFGAKAFATSFESGRTKVKNIELGKQIPTRADLEKIAGVLRLPASELLAGQSPQGPDIQWGRLSGIHVVQEVLDRFPDLAAYLEMLNKAVKIDDLELIEYISAKIAGLLSARIQLQAAGGE